MVYLQYSYIHLITLFSVLLDTPLVFFFFFLKNPATTEISPLPLHHPLPISPRAAVPHSGRLHPPPARRPHSRPPPPDPQPPRPERRAADDLRVEGRDGPADEERLQRHRLARLRLAAVAPQRQAAGDLSVPRGGPAHHLRRRLHDAGAGRPHDPRLRRDPGDRRPVDRLPPRPPPPREQLGEDEHHAQPPRPPDPSGGPPPSTNAGPRVR